MPFTMLHIRAAQGNEDKYERGPLYMEPAVAALHSLRGKNAHVNMEIGMGKDGKIGFFFSGAPGAMGLSESQLYAQYPDVDIVRIKEDPFAISEDEEVISMDLIFREPEVFPIKRHPQFDDILSRVNVDPIAGITSTLARYDEPGMRGHIQIALKPMSIRWRRRAIRFLPLLSKGLSAMSNTYQRFFTRFQLARGWRRLVYLIPAICMGGFRAWPGISRGAISMSMDVTDTADPEQKEIAQQASRSHDREDAVAGALDKVNRLLFLCNVRISVIAPKGKREQAIIKLQEIAGSFNQFSLPNSNAFKEKGVKISQNIHRSFRYHPFALSAEEIATIWHLPTILVQTPNIDWVLSKKLEPPINLPVQEESQEDLTVLGKAVFRGESREFGIKTEDRKRHIYVIGKTGMGKSTLLENMVFSDIHSGKGVGVIDPHGDLIEAILQFIPKERSNDVIIFDPADRDFPISFNILECPDKDQRTLVASGLMSVFTKLWPDVWSGRMEHILRNTLLALLEYEGSSMLGIMRVFSDASYRAKVVSRVSDPLVRSFWEDEFATWSEKYRTEAIAAIQNKVGQLLSTPLIRNIVGQVKSTVDLRHAMDSGKIVLVNLSKGKLGEDTSAFLGSMLVTKFQIDAMSRADVPEEQRQNFFLYVDEFQNFATESFATILSEARKYGLSLTMANQYVAQLLIGDKNTQLRDAVFGNVGSLVSFQVGSDDAEALSLQFEEAVTMNDILSLPKYHAYTRLMIDGVPSKPFSVSTLPPPEFAQDAKRIDVLRRLSRERYAEKRTVVEDKIKKWAASAAEGKGQDRVASKAKEKEEEERARAKKKGMSLDEYRKWRDREMWINDYNVLRKKKLLEEEEWTKDDDKDYKDFEKKLEKSGGIPPVSKGLQELVDRRKKKK